MTRETVPRMLSRVDGAYSGKISCCAPISRCRWGLLRQNLLLRPDIPVSMGLITAKSLSTPRYPGVDGAYYGKIPYLRPNIPVSTGLITAKSLSVPRYPGIDRAYYGKIPYLCPDIPVSTGVITAKFLICAPMYKGGGYNRPGLVSHTRVRESRWVYST